MELYRRILSYLKPHASILLVAVAATFLFASLDGTTYVLLIPFVQAIFVKDAASLVGTNNPMSRILDATVYRWIDLNGNQMHAIEGVILLLLVVFLAKNVFLFAQSYLMAKVQQGVTRDLRNEVYDHLVELDLAFFGHVRMGQIVSRLTTEVEQLRTLVTAQLKQIVTSLFKFAFALVAMLLISWQLTLAAVIVIPGAMIIWGPMVKRLRRGDRRVLHLGAEVNAHIQETLSGIRLVKSSSAETRERERFHRLTQDYFRTFVRTERLRSLAAPLTEMLAAVGTVILLWYGARLVVGHVIPGAQFVAFLALSLNLYSPVKTVAKFPALVQPGLVAAERVFEFLDAPVEIRDRDGAKPFPGLQEEIAFDHVSFAYRAGEPVLQDISFTVPRGSVVAFAGPSGAGKSTLVDLMGRFFEVGEGRITIDGTDLRDIRIADLRANLGIVSQETVLFHDTIRANIAYGRPDASDEDIHRAARAAHADPFISQMPDGYESVVGERGTELSGGQRQRIAIARALLRDPPILILDEATSSLDTESERLVQDAIEHLLVGRTVFVIAHRLSTIQRADQILVLKDGRIVERGDHASLMADGGLYRRLHELQFEDLGASST